jgi:hypothetical protein
MDDLVGGEVDQDRQGTPLGRLGRRGEDDQAMEHLLRRVPDDPAGLLRQRFMLQHLRRTGKL